MVIFYILQLPRTVISNSEKFTHPFIHTPSVYLSILRKLCKIRQPGVALSQEYLWTGSAAPWHATIFLPSQYTVRKVLADFAVCDV